MKSEIKIVSSIIIIDVAGESLTLILLDSFMLGVEAADNIVNGAAELSLHHPDVTHPFSFSYDSEFY